MFCYGVVFAWWDDKVSCLCIAGFFVRLSWGYARARSVIHTDLYVQ